MSRLVALALWVAVGCLSGSLTLGCGADTVGVQSITFAFTPVEGHTPPAGIDVAELPHATGQATVDVVGGRGLVRVTGLPSLPEGFSYTVMLHVTPDPRTWIPGDEDEGSVGHVHGALTGTSDVGLPHAHEGDPPPDQVPVLVQPLGPSIAAPGTLESVFSAADLAPLPLGGVRGGMVVLRSSDPSVASVLLMVGDVTANPASGASSAPASGHVHGA